MFRLILLLFFGNGLGNIIKNISGNFEIFKNQRFRQSLKIKDLKPNCLFLKNQKWKVRKIIVDNNYMTFPYKIGIDRCIGSCNNENNPYFKTCLPDSIKNITVKSLNY